MIQAMDKNRSMVQTMQLIEEQVRQDKGIINYNLYKVLIN